MLNFKLDTIDEKCKEVATQIASYKQQAAKYYNKNVQTRNFQVGEWVLRNFFQNMKESGTGKLGANRKDHTKLLESSVMGPTNYSLRTENTSTIAGTTYTFTDITFEFSFLFFLFLHFKTFL